MKKFLMIFMALTMVVSIAFAKSEKQTVTFYVHMTCQGCVSKIEKNIPFEKGVKDLQCDLKTGTVKVTFDPAKTNVPTLQKAFAKIGKPATTTPPTVQNTDSCTDQKK